MVGQGGRGQIAVKKKKERQTDRQKEGRSERRKDANKIGELKY